MEKLQDMKQRYLNKFDPGKIRDFMLSKGVEIVPFSQHHAEHLSSLLSERYPSSDQWHAFKRDRCLRCLGLPEETTQAKGTGRSCGATVDWLIAGQADAERWLLITSDNDPEFATIRRTSMDTLLLAAEQFLRGPAPG
jgi:hypothetical protein